MPIHKATIKDIAKKVGVSVSTVSRALNDSSNISAETKAKISQVALELNYIPDRTAVSLKDGISKTIGIVVPYNYLLSYQLYRGINKILCEKGWACFLMTTEDNPKQEKRCLTILENLGVSGVIMFAKDAQSNLQKIQSMIENGIHFSFTIGAKNLSNITYVSIDDENNMFFMVERLIENGNHKLAYINMPPYISNAHSHFMGFKAATEKHHLYNPDLIFHSENMEPQNCQQVADLIIKKLKDIDIVVAYNDIIAGEVLKHLLQKGVRVPEDVAIAGFGGSPLSALVKPSITTVEIPVEEICKNCANLMIQKLTDPQYEDRIVTLPAKFVERESTMRH